MSFLRVKTQGSRQYLYSEIRGAGGYQKSTSLGRVGSGFWFWLGVLIQNATEKGAFSLEQFYAEERAQQQDIERKEAERERLAEVVNPASYATPEVERPHSSQGEEVALESPEAAAPEVPQAPPSPDEASVDASDPSASHSPDAAQESEIGSSSEDVGDAAL